MREKGEVREEEEVRVQEEVWEQKEVREKEKVRDQEEEEVRNPEVRREHTDLQEEVHPYSCPQPQLKSLTQNRRSLSEACALHLSHWAEDTKLDGVDPPGTDPSCAFSYSKYELYWKGFV